MIVIAVIVLFVPGLAMAVIAERDEQDPVSFLVAAAVLAVAVWLVVPWFVTASPGGLVRLAVATSALSASILLVCWRRARRVFARLDWQPAHRLALAAVLLLAVVRFAPLGWAEVPPGADMSMHSYTTRLIVEAGGVPSGYRPLLPIDEFGASAPGLPTLGAIIAALTGWPAHRGAFVADCVSQLLVGLVIYAFVRQRAGARASAVAMLVATMVARDPQAYFEWGGAPTVLSLAMVTFAMVQVERVHESRWRSAIVPAALALAAAVVAHTVVPFALVFVLPPTVALRVWRAPRAERLRVGLRLLLIAVAATVLLVPYLARFQVSVSPAELAWIQQWQRLPVHVPPGPWWAAPLTLVWFVGVRLGAIYTAWITAAIIARRWIAARAIREELLMAGVVLALVVNAKLWLLPGSYALYPDRVALLLVPLSARIIGASVEGWCVVGSRAGRRWGALALGVSVVAGTAIWFVPAMSSVSVTEDDIEVINWIAAHTPADAVVENNYGDAGIWIPAMAYRAVCQPHVNIVFMEELEAWKTTVRPAFLYVGARRVMTSRNRFSLAEVAARPERYIEVHRRGQAAVYRVASSTTEPLPVCTPDPELTTGPR